MLWKQDLDGLQRELGLSVKKAGLGVSNTVLPAARNLKASHLIKDSLAKSLIKKIDLTAAM